MSEWLVSMNKLFVVIFACVLLYITRVTAVFVPSVSCDMSNSIVFNQPEYYTYHEACSVRLSVEENTEDDEDENEITMNVSRVMHPQAPYYFVYTVPVDGPDTYAVYDYPNAQLEAYFHDGRPVYRNCIDEFDSLDGRTMVFWQVYENV